MDKGYGQSDPALASYVEELFQLRDPTLEHIQEHADARGLPEIQVSPFDGRILEILTRVVGAKKAVEIGTLAGYSATHILRGMPADGRLYTFEVDPKHAQVARENLERGGFGHRVQIFIGKARDRLAEIVKEGPFDLVFIDADKESYPFYLDWATENLRVSGLAICDNAFAWGNVLKPSTDASAQAIHETNQRLARGDRFCSMMFPTAEGLAVGVKLR